MATVNLKNMRLGFANIAAKATDTDAEVSRVTPRYKRDENNRPTDILEGYNVDIFAVKGCEQTVKLPLAAKPSAEQIQNIMADGKTTVRVRFTGLLLKPYAMLTEGRVMSGISATADSVTITDTEAAEDDTDLIIDL